MLSRPRTRSTRAGYTIIELMVVATILVIAVGGLSSSLVSAIDLGNTNGELIEAHNAARQMAETLQGVDFDEIFATFNDEPRDDPGGPGTALGSDFVYPCELLKDGDPPGFFEGRVIFPNAEGTTLVEQVVEPKLGLPMDLDGDGSIDGRAVDHAGDYLILPVTIEVTWTGSGGRERSLERHLLLYDQD